MCFSSVSVVMAFQARDGTGSSFAASRSRLPAAKIVIE